jgi:hypothetical protein
MSSSLSTAANAGDVVSELTNVRASSDVHGVYASVGSFAISFPLWSPLPASEFHGSVLSCEPYVATEKL